MRYSKQVGGIKGDLICFIGIDGSGKSTCTNTAAAWLHSRGCKYTQIWGAYDSLLLRPGTRIAKRLLLGRYSSPYSDYQEYHHGLRERTQSPALKPYLAALFAEYWLQLLLKVQLPLRRGNWVISDRYVFDTTVSIAANRGMSLDEHIAMCHRWQGFFPKPALTVWVDVPPEVSVTRKADIPAPLYLEIRRPYYENLARVIPDIVRLDGTLPQEFVNQRVVELVHATVDEKNGCHGVAIDE